MPFSTIELAGAGDARFVVRNGASPDPTTFSLTAGNWYYFETTFTRGTGNEITYDMLIANASSSGVIGSTINTYSLADSNTDLGGGTGALDGDIYGAFKGDTAYTNGAAATLDNFYVSAAGVSQIPEPSVFGILISTCVCLLLLRRRRS